MIDENNDKLLIKGNPILRPQAITEVVGVG